MDTHESFDAAQTSRLVERIQMLQEEGYRLVQIGCLKAADGASASDAAPAAGGASGAGGTPPAAESLEIIYSFDKDYALTHLRLHIGERDRVPSVSTIYEMAFLYENEIHDLFGVNFEGLTLDFHGTFYQKRSAVPFIAVDGQGL